MFSPPLHRQRHQFVVDFVKENKPKKVADLGCGEGGLLEKLRFHREVELLVGVDVNGAKVKRNMHRLTPLATDYLQPSYDPLCIELYQGSVTHKDSRLRGFDLVTSIELIEHLPLADVDAFSEVVFGYMSPVAVIISTPNSDFNPLLPGLAGYRHPDHKFEWTRAEFRYWALKVCGAFGYEVEFTGVGQAPSGQRVGFCSQIGVFLRHRGKDGCNTFGDEDTFSYTLLCKINYPSLRDNATLQRVLASEVLYWSDKLKRGRTDQESVSTWCQTEGGQVERLSVVPPSASQTAAACNTQTERPVGRLRTGVSEELDEEASWTNCQGQQESCGLMRYVAVPLALLWSSSPKVRELSGSLNNLRQLLKDEPKVKLSQDGAAVLLSSQEEQEQDPEEEDVLADSGYVEVSQCSPSTQHGEDWEAEI